jgi:hypothetical protein
LATTGGYLRSEQNLSKSARVPDIQSMNFMSHFRKLFTHFRYVMVIRFHEPLVGVSLSQISDQTGVEKKCASQMTEPR